MLQKSTPTKVPLMSSLAVACMNRQLVCMNGHAWWLASSVEVQL